MSPGDPVEDALNETLAALREGAVPWTVPQEVGEAYKAALRPDFRDKVKSYWESLNERVKRMAMHSGFLAGLIAQRSDPGAEPRGLTQAEVFRGAALVKESKACPPVEGRFCQQADFGPLQPFLDGVFTAGKVTVNQP